MTTTFVPRKKSIDADKRGLGLVMIFEAGGLVVEPPTFTLTPGLNIGRELEGDNALTVTRDNVMSRLHAAVREGRTLVDKSTNGTFVNGEKITERALVDGDLVRMGTSLFLVRDVELRPPKDLAIPALVGCSRELKKLRTTLGLMAPTTSTVLLLGETGTGKDVAARAVHELSERKGPFIAINCAAIPDTLAESQLFGHVAGAFTGARGAEPGAFRSASGGTLFLDEIGELSAAVQAKLLRVLENHEVVPLGSSELHKVDVRVVCATHQDLVKETKKQGGFRRDLYARIAELVLRLPPLRERREDILMLLARFLPEGAPPITVELAERLVLHSWPFNVRELKKLAAHLALHKDAASLDVELVADRLAEHAGDEAATATAAAGAVDDDDGEDAPARTKATAPAPTRDEVIALLQKHGGNIFRIAKETGRSRKSVYRWIEQLGLKAEDYRHE